MVNAGDEGHTGPLARLIAFSAHNRLLVLLVVLAAGAWGWRSLVSAPLDAIPDLSDVQVILLAEWPGRSPDLVEDQITYPLTAALLGAPRVRAVRGQSFMGLSFVYVIFADGTDLYWARSRVLEYLSAAAAKLPEGVRPTLGPDATAVGWVYQYALVDRSGRHSLAELRSLQDFNLRYALASVPGVAEVAAVGGFVQEYQIEIDPNRLASRGIPLARVLEAVRASNAEIGGRELEIAGHEHFIRGRGYVRSAGDLEQVVIGLGPGGVPIRVADVGSVRLGPALARGQTDLDGEGMAVGGIVVMRNGENALAVIGRVEERLAEVRPSLPPGVEIVPVYDRSGLIERAIATLRRTLVEEMAVVALVIFVFLLHLRSALVVAITLPVAILLAFIPMYYQGLTANIMSLGGIAVAIGAMVDAAIAMVENVHRRLHLWQLGDADARRRGATRTAVVIDAMQEVGPSIFFALLVIAVSFIPVFALAGSEGRLFRPLAFTKTYAMLFAALLSVTLVPALAALVIRGRVHGDDSRLNRALVSAYRPLVLAAVRRRGPVLALAALALASALYPALRLGREFMPPLNEGSILYMPTTLPGISLAEATRVLQTMDRELRQFPEVERVFGKVGRSTSATDPAPLEMIETNILLKPQSEWRPGLTWDRLIGELDAAMRFPGLPNVWWMPIQTRTEMLATGVRSALGIKVFGPELGAIEQTAVAIERALLADPRTAPHTRSALAERATGGYFVDFDIDRAAAARHGLNVGDVQAVLEAAVGGARVGETVAGRARYDILVRYAREYRDSPAALERILIPTATGAQIPITQVADLHFRTGPPLLRSEGGQLLGLVAVDPGPELGIADYVALAQQVVRDRVPLPSGVRLVWAGQFEHYERARARLALLVPMTLGLIFFLLYLHRRSLIETLILLLALPFSLVGSLWLLWLLGYKLSVAAAVGMIAVAGLAVELGILMLLYLDLAWRQRLAAGGIGSRAELTGAIVEGAALRLRPKLMTGCALLLGLAPILYSTGTGADVMKRIAAPMLGGVASALLLVLIVFPALFSYWRGRGLPG